MGDDGTTPMVKQYLAIKEQYNDAILFYRIGDFYEMFFEDAEVASKLLDITLTSRNKNDPNPIPLCGVPYHSVEPYIAKLLSYGKKVAVCDQVEDPQTAKGVVKREVTRVITPGLIFEGESICASANNFIAALTQDSAFGFALADVSTGYFSAAQFNTAEELANEIRRLEPKEILLPAALANAPELMSALTHQSYEPLFTTLNEEYFTTGAIQGLDGASSIVASSPNAARAASAIWLYIAHTQKGEPKHIRRIETYANRKTMQIDEGTRRNLELFKTMIEGAAQGSLINLLDKTHTAMGARRLREWMIYPLMDVSLIEERLGAVNKILTTDLLSELPRRLAGVWDLERIGARIAMGRASARDLAALKNSLEQIPQLIEKLPPDEANGKDLSSISHADENNSSLLDNLRTSLDPLSDIADEIGRTIIADPPFSVREGGIIREGVSAELDELRGISGGGKDAIARIEAREKGRTGINSLKVKYNKVFGYYIEITNAHKDRIPEDYIRKQTLVNAERYITPELKEYEEKVLSAEDKIRALEYEIFDKLREKIADESSRIYKTAGALATLDVLTSFALTAGEYRYTRPKLNDGGEIKITEGRHPIIERLNPIERFVPNDVYLNGSDQRLVIITGPNMAGKSTVMRQTALIVLMAQMGSFVPAKEASIGVVDRIFTRIGASDALSLGQSTFMVEMSEASAILKQATDKSLIIIDEIGRGTSTFDGLSLAWAIAEDIHDRVKARTLFATHYHELTDLAATKEGIKNFNIAVKEYDGKVIFLRKLVPGGTSRSYGIQVAKLAGLPHGVIERAQEVLKNLESEEFDEIGKPKIASHGQEEKSSSGQLHLFTKPLNAEVARRLEELDTSVLTPIEALNILHELKQKI